MERELWVDRLSLLCEGFVQTLIKADLLPHVKGDTVKGDEGVCPHLGKYIYIISVCVCVEGIALLTAAQTLIYSQSRLMCIYNLVFV